MFTHADVRSRHSPSGDDIFMDPSHHWESQCKGFRLSFFPASNISHWRYGDMRSYVLVVLVVISWKCNVISSIGNDRFHLIARVLWVLGTLLHAFGTMNSLYSLVYMHVSSEGLGILLYFRSVNNGDKRRNWFPEPGEQKKFTILNRLGYFTS